MHTAPATAAPATRRATPPWAAPAAVGVAAVGACVVAGLTDSGDTWLPVCPLKTMTGLDCPGCGMTRALRALTHGQLGAAADHNLLLVVALPLLIVLWALWLGRSLGLTQARLITWQRSTVVTVVAVLLGFWLLRELPWEPFSWLASGRA